MTPRIAELKDYIVSHRHHALRHEVKWDLAERFAAAKTDKYTRVVEALEEVLKAETPAFLPNERIALIRTVSNLPEIYTEAEMAEMKRLHSFCEQGKEFNFTPDYASVIGLGFDALKEKIQARMATADEDGRNFLAAGIRSIDAVLAFAERYRAAAEAQGLDEIARTLSVVPHKKATTFLEAMQFFRILHYTMWCEGEYHNGVGRIDVWLYPYLKHSLESGELTREQAFELYEEFFLSFNRDSDLYVGVQQGDNGQSLMIGGCDAEGNEVWNDISEMTLKASRELLLIDPKINFRVSTKTPLERLVMGAELTKAGLGFPQYSNDDVVIPALVKMGYELKDARDYAVAACWEFIIPGICREAVNLDAMSVPAVLIDVLDNSSATNYDDFLAEFGSELRKRAEALVASWANISFLPGIFVSMLCPVSIEKAQTISYAGKYHNWGVHGPGMAVAADSLTALRQVVFEKHERTLAEFSRILKDDYKNAPDLLAEVRNCVPKLGQNSPEADESLKDVIRLWGAAWKGLRNAQGGLIRPGTSSAMYYIWYSRDFQATPDGRKAGEPFPANYAPALDVQVDGPLSVIRSFTSPDFTATCNGGPLTIELHNSIFTAPEAVESVARMIAEFIRRGGHQLQLNSINRDTLLDAQAHPEKYRNLIVRVWGWSGYFVELDKVYQDHIIRRAEMMMNG